MIATVPRGGSLSALLVGIDGDLATAGGAEVVWIDPTSDRATLTTMLTKAAEKAITRTS